MLTERQENYVKANLQHSNRVIAAGLGIKASYVAHYLLKNKIKKREIQKLKANKNELRTLTEKQRHHYKPCPRHGNSFLVAEGAAVFCYAETPGEMVPRCFYHVSRGRL